MPDVPGDDAVAAWAAENDRLTRIMLRKREEYKRRPDYLRRTTMRDAERAVERHRRELPGVHLVTAAASDGDTPT